MEFLKKIWTTVWSDDWQCGVLPLAEDEGRSRVSWIIRLIIVVLLAAAAFMWWGMPDEAVFHHPQWTTLIWVVWTIGTVGLMSEMVFNLRRRQYVYPRRYSFAQFYEKARGGIFHWIMYTILPYGRSHGVGQIKHDRDRCISIILVYGIVLGLWWAMERYHSAVEAPAHYTVYMSPEMRRERVDKEQRKLRYAREDMEREERENEEKWQRRKAWLKNAALHPAGQLAAWGLTLLLTAFFVRMRWRRRMKDTQARLEKVGYELHDETMRLTDVKKNIANMRQAVAEQIAIAYSVLERMERRRGDKDVGRVRVDLHALIEMIYPGDSNQSVRDRLAGMAERVLREEAQKASEPKPPAEEGEHKPN